MNDLKPLRPLDMRSGRSIWDVLAVVLTVCALATTGILLKRELFGGRELPTAQGSTPSHRVADWLALSASGHRIGRNDAAVTIVEFADFECPFCARFAKEVVKPFLMAHPDDVALVYRHFPLPYHTEALRAARAAECAATQGQFHAYHDLLYENQKALRSISFDSLARIAEVPDSARFSTCLQDDTPMASVDGDTTAALKIGLRGTPTVIVNAMQFSSPPTRLQLDSILDEAQRP